MSFKNSSNLEGALEPFLPKNSIELVCEKLREYPHHLVITPPRSTKLGDFTADPKGKKHILTVNGNLNQYAFLITLMHELAHLITWVKYKDKVKPHGQEWKSEFKQTLGPFLRREVFPDDIALAVKKYLINPSAATCTDIQLSVTLAKYDKKSHPNVKLLIEVPLNGRFIYGRNKRIFIKGEKIRSRYRCLEEKTKYEYLFNPLTKILHLTE